jgi:hypothetical protein
MYAIATCLASILRGTGTDQWGDTTDSGTIVYTGIPARIVVKSSSVYDSATQSARVIQQVIGIVGSAIDVTDSDQIRDDTHSATYTVESVTQPLGPGRTPDLELELRRVK